jgi:hypothetical protein
MKTPPLLLGASLIFWGWQTGLFVLGTIMALVLEGSRLVKSRWEFSSSDFNRIRDLCILLFLGMLIYIYASKKSTHAILVVIQWLPLALLPLLVSQVYSASNRVNVRTLFVLLRKKGAEEAGKSQTTIDLTYPYFALCILSASAANVRTSWFYVGLIFLSAWALWSERSRRYSPILCLCLLALAGFLGYLGQIGLHRLQTVVEDRTVEWFSDLRRRESDPYRTGTAIGDIGSLKPSDRILFRVKLESEIEPPLLLLEATYNLYQSAIWFARRSKFTPLQPDTDGASWDLQSDLGTRKFITISTYLRWGKGILKLPRGSSRIERLPVAQAEQNQYGVVKVEDGPGLINYRVRFSETNYLGSPPDETDLVVPQQEAAAISEIVQKLQLTSKSPREIMETVASYFRSNFGYSLVLNSDGTNTTPITDFLRHSLSGHCEYFATATVLLLRKAGIPARYATGYSVNEGSALEDRFVVRERHAHAWTLAYIDGAWHDFDTTPSSWRSIEAEAASGWEPILDIWSWCVFKFSEWRWREKEGGIAKYMWWLLIPLIFLLGRRLYSRKVVTPFRPAEDLSRAELKPGANSEFYLIEKKLGESGFRRNPWETLSRWIEKIEESESSLVSTESLRSILELHYRYRFDPVGITQAEKSELESKVRSWLTQHPNLGG